MREYRRYFIRLNMLLVGAVLLATLVIAGVYMIQSEYNNMRQIMFETLEPFQEDSGLHSYTLEEKPEKPSENAKEPSFGRCITVFFENGEGSIVSGIGENDAQTILAAASLAAKSEESFGYLQEYKLYYLCTGMPDSAKISLYPSGYLHSSVLKICLSLLGAFALTLLACYGVSRYISKIAIRPVRQAMAREKQFVADVSHDLKTPLAVMQACHHILLENPQGTIEKAKPWLEKSNAAMENMKSLIDDMLTLSAMDSQRKFSRRETVSLSSVVTKAVLQMEPMAYDRGIALDSEIQENIILQSDAEALLRMVSGLLENALKYEPENGQILVKLEAHGRQKLLQIQNKGSFIAAEDLPHIFERFYRTDKARTAQQGHGLGLAIIKRTVELAGGHIQVESNREIGTVFSVALE